MATSADFLAQVLPFFWRHQRRARPRWFNCRSAALAAPGQPADGIFRGAG